MSSKEASRLKNWNYVACLSIISLVSICKATKTNGRDSVEKFAIAVTSMSVIIGTMFVIIAKWSDRTGKPNKLNGTVIELGAATFNFVMWCIGMGFIHTRNTDFYAGGVENANIYYFT